MTQLVTGEAVALDLNLAALPSRFVARAIDAGGQLVLFFVLSIPLGFAAQAASEALGAGLSVLVLVTTVIGYPVFFEALLRGRTPGKMAMGLRVVRDDGGPIAFRQSFVRGLSSFIDLLTLYVPSVVIMLLGERSKRIGDHLAGTVVVLERSPVQPGPVAVMPPPLAGWAQQLQLNGLSDELALAIRQFVSRAPTMNAVAREQLGAALAADVAKVTSPAPPVGTPGWAYLSAVLAERRRRDSARLAAEGWALHGAPPMLPGAAAARPSYVPPPSYGPSPYGAPAGSGAPAPGAPAYRPVAGSATASPQAAGAPAAVTPPLAATGFTPPG